MKIAIICNFRQRTEAKLWAEVDGRRLERGRGTRPLARLFNQQPLLVMIVIISPASVLQLATARLLIRRRSYGKNIFGFPNSEISTLKWSIRARTPRENLLLPGLALGLSD